MCKMSVCQNVCVYITWLYENSLRCSTKAIFFVQIKYEENCLGKAVLIQHLSNSESKDNDTNTVKHSTKSKTHSAKEGIQSHEVFDNYIFELFLVLVFITPFAPTTLFSTPETTYSKRHITCLSVSGWIFEKPYLKTMVIDPFFFFKYDVLVINGPNDCLWPVIFLKFK